MTKMPRPVRLTAAALHVVPGGLSADPLRAVAGGTTLKFAPEYTRNTKASGKATGDYETSTTPS